MYIEILYTFRHNSIIECKKNSQNRPKKVYKYSFVYLRSEEAFPKKQHWEKVKGKPLGDHIS